MKNCWSAFLLRLAMLIALGLVLLVAVWRGTPCLFRRLTGIPCPCCGMSRAWIAALRLDFRGAFSFHPVFWSLPVLAAGLLGIFLGGLGIHNFYLGYTGKAVAQLMICVFGFCVLVGPVVAGIWGLVEGIMIFCDRAPVDANGVPLRD